MSKEVIGFGSSLRAVKLVKPLIPSGFGWDFTLWKHIIAPSKILSAFMVKRACVAPCATTDVGCSILFLLYKGFNSLRFFLSC